MVIGMLHVPKIIGGLISPMTLGPYMPGTQGPF